MRKRALIIAAPLARTDDGYAPGVIIDAENWRRFFNSATGGGFYDKEITVLKNPPRKLILACLQAVSADYSVIVFSGHGSYSTSVNSTILLLNQKRERIAISEMVGYFPKELFITNCCRNIESNSYLGATGDPFNYLTFQSHLTFEEGRRIHNSRLERTPDGRSFLYAASIGQSAMTSSDGSHFCNGLLRGLGYWGKQYAQGSVLNLETALSFSREILKREYPGDQQPTLGNLSRHVNFPFAVRYGTELVLHRRQAVDSWANAGWY